MAGSGKLLAQTPVYDFSGGRARHIGRRHKADDLGQFVTCQLLLAPLFEFISMAIGIGFQHHHSLHGFAPFLMRDTNDSDFLYRRVSRQHRFDL